MGEHDESVDDGEAVGESPRALPLLLGIVAMICIPLGLIVLFLAFTGSRDEPAPTDLTPVDGPPATTQVAVPSPLLAGRWNVLAGPGSWVGYRATQNLPRVPNPVTVEGRTEDVTGGLVIDGTGTVVAVALNVDLTTLTSDDAQLDDAIRIAGLETDRYPNATFVLTEPIELPKTVVSGQPFPLEARGDLTLHGVTRPVTLGLQAQLVPTDPYRIELAGDIEVKLSDFAVPLDEPNDLVRFQDDAVVALHLVFTRIPDEVALNVPDGTAAPGTTPAGTAPAGGTPPGSTR